ncbi:cytochrome b561 domain-containing protein 2 [Drosophila elegans]|uniref:cytochrome b561 domain-containing protein 2 n=1 Tax=Drosophila elegans TaxID=30023 RepID=UPI0007E83057|nr:cytochrome b561 domain-containing protein 2 [Drosophila elegans]
MSQAVNATTHVVIYKFAWPLLMSLFEVNLYRIVLELGAHILLVVLTLVVARKSRGMDDHRSGRHAVFSTLGLLLCVGEALLLSHSWWLQELTRKRLTLLHMALGIVGIWLGSVGIFQKSWAKRKQEGDRHFASKHGCCGLLGILLIGVSLATGLLLVYLSHLTLHLLHRVAGLTGFVCLCCSQWFALNLGFARREWKSKQIKWLKIAILGATISVSGYEFLCLSTDILHLLPAISQPWV